MERFFERRSFLKTAGLAALFRLPAYENRPARGQDPLAPDIDSAQIRTAVQKACTWLIRKQNGDGSWSGHSKKGGLTALCTLALLTAGENEKSPAIMKGIEYLKRADEQYTYTASLKCQVFAAADPDRYAAALKKAAAFLVAAQNPDGMWTYTINRGRTGDNSNTQFALLGLHEAAKGGVAIPRTVWTRSNRHFVDNQCEDGGWGYQRRQREGYGSMTAAAVASLYICGEDLNVGGRKTFRDGAYPDCGQYGQNKVIAGGLEWLIRNFSVKTNPGRGSWPYYYLYALERVGMITGMRTFGRYDWYRLGAGELVGKQNDDGHWGRDPSDTAFALLFLAKGNRPVLFQKVQWNGRWNRNIHDIEHLCAFIGDKLGKPTTWQSTALDIPLEELRTSPVLLVTGHRFPAFSERETVKLRSFIREAGGTLLFEACCGSKEFADGFRAYVKKLAPEHTLRPLEADHPVFHTYYDLQETCGLQGLGSGCRTSVFFSPRALSCLWELEDIPDYSKKALMLGTNIAAYATANDQLRDRLDIIKLPKTRGDRTDAVEIPRGAVRVARIIHRGDYNADPVAVINLCDEVRNTAGIDVFSRSRHLRADDEAIFEYPVVFMNGHYAFTLNNEERRVLASYLSRGGMLLADSCCGKSAFDKSFRNMANSLFPENRQARLKPLDRKHPLYTDKTGITLGELRYRPALANMTKKRGTTFPPLEGLALDGQFVILYSKYDWCCAFQGDRPFSCLGYTDTDGRKLGVALLLYAMSF